MPADSVCSWSAGDDIDAVRNNARGGRPGQRLSHHHHWRPSHSPTVIMQLARRRSLQVCETRSNAMLKSENCKAQRARVKIPHPLWQRTAPSGTLGAHRDSEQCPRDGANAPFSRPRRVRLWTRVGRADDPCRSTVRVSTWTRVIYSFCSVY